MLIQYRKLLLEKVHQQTFKPSLIFTLFMDPIEIVTVYLLLKFHTKRFGAEKIGRH